MTTISYKDGIMAAEGKMTLGDMVIKLDTEKVFWVNNHLVGVCGRARAINTFVTWLQKMTDYHIVNQEVGELVDLVPPALEDDEGYSALVVTPSRQVLMYEGNTPIDMGLDVPMSVGSGSCFALAAMKAGNSAEEAVKVACELDVYSGGEITVVQLEEEPEPLTREVAENLSKEELINMMFGEEENKEIAGRGYTGRSGSAAGADSAFEQGFNHYDTVNGVSDYVSFEAYLPWKGFSDINEDTVHIVTPELPNYNKAVEIASTIHPAWNRLGRGVKALHTRNVYQVLGLDLKTPSKALFCYAQPTKNKQGIVTGVKGGTNTAVQLAMKHNIPIYNFYLQEDIDKVKSLMENYKV